MFRGEGAASVGNLLARAEPNDTHVFIDFDESEEAARKLVSMGERTCFLHATMRGTYPCRVQVELNGERVPGFETG